MEKEIENKLSIRKIYRKLKDFYEYLPRDPALESYLDHFSFAGIIDKIYAVGPYCWFISDMQNGKFRKIGGALEQLTGYKPEELLDASFIKAARFTSAEHLTATLMAAEQFWNYLYSQPVENRAHIKSSHTYTFIRKDGSSFHALQQSSTVFFDHMGNAVYQFDLITDITHLDPLPKLRFFLMDTTDISNIKNIPIHEGIIRKKEPIPISTAEKKVLELIAQGKSIKLIAHELHISENTVKHHRSSMFMKCEVKNMAELITKSITNGWFSVS